MTHIERVMKEAIAIGKYKFNAPYVENNCELLDPLFWQAFGRARSGIPCGRIYRGKKCDVLTKCSGCGKGYGKMRNTAWQVHWHRFISHLIQGGTAEDFFKNL